MSFGGSLSLFSAQASDANGSAVDWPGGRGLWVAWGTWGSGSMKLQLSPDHGTTWIDMDSVTATANGGQLVDLPRIQIRAALSGSTAPSLNSTLYGVPLT